MDSPVAAAADMAAGMGLQGSAVRNGMLRLRGIRGIRGIRGKVPALRREVREVRREDT